MKITQMRVRHLYVRLDEPMRPRGDLGYRECPHTGTENSWLAVVELDTDAGITGLAVIVSRGEQTLQCLANTVAPMLVGKDPTAVWERVVELRACELFDPKVATHLEFGLWDIVGKQRRQPLYKLLGGRDDPAPAKVYAGGASMCWNALDLLVEEALHHKAQGFAGLKIKIGHGPDEDLEIVARVREAIGPDLFIVVDANRAYTLPDALRFVKGLERYGVNWFEEPFPYAVPEGEHDPWDCERVDDWGIEQYQQLRRATTVEIAGGEGFCDHHLIGRLLAAGCFDVYQPDAGYVGVLTMVSLNDMAVRLGVPLTPHACGDTAGFVAGLHLQTITEHAIIQEYETWDNPLVQSIYRVFPRLSPDSAVAVPSAPGLGVNLDETTCEMYLVSSETFK